VRPQPFDVGSPCGVDTALSGKRRARSRMVLGSSSASRASRFSNSDGLPSREILNPRASRGLARPPRSRAGRWSAWLRGTWEVSSAVTAGLPSRSPPDHEPHEEADARAGRVPGQSGVAGEPTGAVPAASDPGSSIPRSRPCKCAHARKSVSSKKARAVRTSSIGVAVFRTRGPHSRRSSRSPLSRPRARRQAEIGRLFEKPVAAPQRGQHRAPAGFSGMGGRPA